MLAIENLEVSYQGVITAVHGVSLEVPDHGVVALLGANGAGKTTILRAISGLLPLHGGRVIRGSIQLDGRPITSLDPTKIVRLGIAQVLEGRRLFAELTVEENLRSGALARRDGAAVSRAYDRVMDLFPLLRERRNSIAGFLSGGEQQMLAIGRGLMAEPKLLILDEPSLGLSPLLVEELFALIGRIRADGVAILLVEQNVVQSLEVADRAYILAEGNFVMSGAASTVAANPELKRAYLGL